MTMMHDMGDILRGMAAVARGQFFRRPRKLDRLAAPAGGAASVALQANPVSHQGERAALGARVAFVALQPRFPNLLGLLALG